MAESALPYVPAYGNVTKVLEKIKAAQTPPRFTQDFLATTLDMPGGSAKPVIPFLKRTGFLASDGTPTDLYRRFRNSAQIGAAAADALRLGYKPLYAANEYIHDAKDSDLKGLVVQITGAQEDSKQVQAIVGCFKNLKAYADFDSGDAVVGDEEVIDDELDVQVAAPPALHGGLNLGYTINLHLPATSDVAVFNAIFKSLREHLLR